MTIEDAFLHDILAHPDDDAPRLIFADWLDEHNDPRGEFIRIQCALAQLSDEDPHRWPLEQREQELLREHEAEWLPKFIGNAPCIFRRGFVEKITLYLHDCRYFDQRLFEQMPIRYLRLDSANAESSIERTWVRIELPRSPHLARLRGLSLEFPLNREEFQSLIKSPYLDQLSDLKLYISNLEDVSLIDWEQAIRRPTLRSLDLSGTRLRSPLFQVLARTPYLAELTALNLTQTGIALDDLRILANSSSLTSLRELNLNGNRLTHEAASVLAEGRLLSQLEMLYLDSNLLGDAGAVAIRDWPNLPRLSRLSLGHNQIFPAGVQALSKAPALRGLISLDLFGNVSCDEGAAAIASSEWTRLQALNLRFNGVGDQGVRALAHSKSLSQLTRLNLTANRITSEGTRALIDSSGLPCLARLDLLRNDIAAAEQAKLRERFPFVYF